MIAENTKIRIDSGYFSKEAIAAESLVESLPHHPFSDITSVFRKGIFDIKADTYVAANEGIPFVRIGDLKGGLIQKDSTAWISDDAHRLEAKTALKRGDLVISKTAYPAASMVNLKECNVSQDTIAVRLNPFGRAQFKSGFIAAFLNTKQGYSLMARRFQGNVQQHLSLEDGKAIRIPLFGLPLQNRVHAIVQAADRQQNASSKKHKEAEDTLLEALGLADWKPPEPLSYTARASDAFTAGRLDAEFFQPRLKSLINKFEEAAGDFRLVALGDYSEPLKYGSSEKLEYTDKGTPFLRITDLDERRFDLSSVKFIDKKLTFSKAETAKSGDILVSRSGTLGLAAPITEEFDAAIFGSYFIRVRPDNSVFNTEFLALFINSIAGVVQFEAVKTGGIQTNLTISAIENLMIPLGTLEWQATFVTLASEGLVARDRAHQTLKAAKRAVEIAVENGEAAALGFLDQSEGAI